MINCVLSKIVFFLIFYNLIFIIIPFRYFYALRNKVQQGYIKCLDKGLYKTCIFENVYYINKKWIIFSDNTKYYNICVNAYAKKLETCWKIYIYSFSRRMNEVINIYKIYNGISVPFGLTYNGNYAHAFWDDLYSIYASMVKIGYKNERFNLVINKPNYRNLFIKDIYNVFEKFSKGKNIYLQNLKEKQLFFEKLIVGSSHQCQRCVTLDYSLKYSREYNITKLYRDRMYNVFDIKPSFDYPINGIIVHNKRYNQYEINILKNLTLYYQSNKYIKLQYVDFRNITPFYQQLRLMSKIHIYISGPGTGLLNFPFMSDPGIIIHLGHIHFGCPQYLEQYMIEGSPHFKAFYYSPQKRMQKLNISYIVDMIEISIQYIKHNQIIYVKKGENLNSIGKLYTKICSEHKLICEKLLLNYDWGYGKCRGIWAENVVYFPSLYKKIPELKDIVISYNSTQKLGCKVGINISKQNQCSK